MTKRKHDSEETKMCVYVGCDQKATVCTGHVVDKDGVRILAGWCKKHANISQGYAGRYRRSFGKRAWTA